MTWTALPLVYNEYTMEKVTVICVHCGTKYYVDIDVKNKSSLCPAPNCYGKRTTCYKCDQVAKFTQPDKDTGQIVDVCDKHFIFMHMG